MALAPVQAEELCKCGKPASHLLAHPDTSLWACRIPRAVEFDAEISTRQTQIGGLLGVRVARRGVQSAERDLAAAVATARKGGASWREVGLAAGMTGRGAQKRWGTPLDRPGGPS